MQFFSAKLFDTVRWNMMQKKAAAFQNWLFTSIISFPSDVRDRIGVTRKWEIVKRIIKGEMEKRSLEICDK
jgi:hypothetical protein